MPQSSSASTSPDESPREQSPADAKAAMDDLRQPIEAALDQATAFGSGCPENLASAIRYALLAPGKRLRPALVLMAAEACGGSIDEAMPGAVAVEMIHAYSLIHDDLPAMDDDDLRRGRPTVHIAFDEATAILAGDALQPQAFLHLSESGQDPRRAIEAVRILGQAASAERLVGGQADDLAAESRTEDAMTEPKDDSSRNLEKLESIHRRKTGALFAASLELGAVLSGASPEGRAAVVAYANDLGLAFQVVDDLLDFEADESRLGKRAGKDAERGKLTYPGLLGIDAGDAAWRLNILANFVLRRTH